MSGRRNRWRQRRGPYRHREYGPRQAEELVEIDAVLRDAPELVAAMAKDIEEVSPRDQIMTAEQCLRAFLIKDMNQCDYVTLAQKLADSRGYERFCGTDASNAGDSRDISREDLAGHDRDAARDSHEEQRVTTRRLQHALFMRIAVGLLLELGDGLGKRRKYRLQALPGRLRMKEGAHR